MIMNMTFGGAVLNFKVVGSASEPSSPTENLVWIKTSLSVPYSYLNAQPAPTWANDKGVAAINYEPVTGSGSISSSNAALNILKQRTNGVLSIYVKLIGCYQNQDGTKTGWKRVPAYIYKSGSWVQFSSETVEASEIYYYNKGDKCTSATGGWSAGTASSGYTAGTPSFESDKVTCVSTGAYSLTTAVTENKVDVTDLDKIYVTSPSGSSANNGYYGYFCLCESRDGTGNRAAQVQIPKGGGTTTLDVSSMSGSYYLMLRMLAGSTGPDQVDMSVCYGKTK